MPGTAARIQISEKQQLVLEEFSRSRTIAQCVVPRSTIHFAVISEVVE